MYRWNKVARTPPTLYHVTRAENTESILAEGLRANAHGEIFTVTTKRRINDVGVRCSALIAVDTAGITGHVERGFYPYYRVIYQPAIEPRYLTLLWVGRAN